MRCFKGKFKVLCGYGIWVMSLCAIQSMAWLNYFHVLHITATTMDLMFSASKMYLFSLGFGVPFCCFSAIVLCVEEDYGVILRIQSRKKIYWRQIISVGKYSMLHAVFLLLTVRMIGVVFSLENQNWDKMEGFFFRSTNELPSQVSFGWANFYFLFAAFLAFLFLGILPVLSQWIVGSRILGCIVAIVVFVADSILANTGIYYGRFAFSPNIWCISLENGWKIFLHPIGVLAILMFLGNMVSERREFYGNRKK